MDPENPVNPVNPVKNCISPLLPELRLAQNYGFLSALIFLGEKHRFHSNCAFSRNNALLLFRSLSRQRRDASAWLIRSNSYNFVKLCVPRVQKSRFY